MATRGAVAPATPWWSPTHEQRTIQVDSRQGSGDMRRVVDSAPYVPRRGGLPVGLGPAAQGITGVNAPFIPYGNSSSWPVPWLWSAILAIPVSQEMTDSPR